LKSKRDNHMTENKKTVSKSQSKSSAKSGATIDAKKDDYPDDVEPIIIKKYANRRLYNMAESKYVTLDGLAKMIRDGEDFVVYDTKTGEDITRSILTQIIFEEEGKGNHILPMSFLRDMIMFYGDNVNNFVPDYWEASMGFFKDHREKMQSGLQKAMTNASLPFEQFQKVADSNRDIMQKTLGMFSIFSDGVGASAEGEEMVTIPKSEYESMKKKINDLAK